MNEPWNAGTRPVKSIVALETRISGKSGSHASCALCWESAYCAFHAVLADVLMRSQLIRNQPGKSQNALKLVDFTKFFR
jgi:hypothetical protein